jgi:hypothetical protein
MDYADVGNLDCASWNVQSFTQALGLCAVTLSHDDPDGALMLWVLNMLAGGCVICDGEVGVCN